MNHDDLARLTLANTALVCGLQAEAALDLARSIQQLDLDPDAAFLAIYKKSMDAIYGD